MKVGDLVVWDRVAPRGEQRSVGVVIHILDQHSIVEVKWPELNLIRSWCHKEDIKVISESR